MTPDVYNVLSVLLVEHEKHTLSQKASADETGRLEGKLANLKRDNEDMYVNNGKLHQQVDDLKKQLTVAERRNDGLKASQDKFKEIFDAAMAVAYSHARGRYNLAAADKLAKLFHVSRAELAKCPECQAVGEKTASATCMNIWHNSDSERHMVFGPEMGVKEEKEKTKPWRPSDFLKPGAFGGSIEPYPSSDEITNDDRMKWMNENTMQEWVDRQIWKARGKQPSA